MKRVSIQVAAVIVGAGVVAASALLLPDAMAQQRPGERGPGGPGGPGGEASVSRSMKGMDRALKGLKSQIDDASRKAECLKLINDFQRAIVAAKGQPVPEYLLRGASNAEKEKKSATFRNKLILALRTALDIEVDIIEGRSEAAAAKIESLITLRDKAHEELGVEED